MNSLSGVVLTMVGMWLWRSESKKREAAEDAKLAQLEAIESRLAAAEYEQSEEKKKWDDIL